MKRNDTRVKTWNGLIKKLYNIPEISSLKRYRSQFVYRGLADKTWDLETSLQRLHKKDPQEDPRRYSQKVETVEKSLLRSFCKYAKPESLPSDSYWVQLAIAQHHGLPTRLMDWTVSPQVAVHFATFEEEHYDKDGVIWCVNVYQAHEMLPQEKDEFLVEDECSGEKEFVLDKEKAFLFSIKMLEPITSMDYLDRLGKDQNFALFFEPPSLDNRIVNQGAIMSVMPGRELILSDFLRKNPLLYQRIIIPKELKWEVRDKLDQDNVTERMLFPGLDGLSKWLKRYYGPGPNRP